VLRFEPKIQIKKEEDREVLVVGPFERGLGHTIGNGLRRTLLSYLPGAAVTEVIIDGVPHEFSTVPGLREDVIELVLNIKKIIFKMEVAKPLIVTLDATGPGEVKAGDLKCPTGIEVLNKDMVLAHLADKKSRLKMELKVEFGRGYHLVDQQKSKVGLILVDADFSPVKTVAYRVEPARVGRVTGLDQIVFDIKTDGSITALEALKEASGVLEEHFALLKGDIEVREVWHEDQVEKRVIPQKPPRPVYLEEFNLPTRLTNALREAGIQTIEDVKKAGLEKLKKVKNVGPKSVELLTQTLGQFLQGEDRSA